MTSKETAIASIAHNLFDTMKQVNTLLFCIEMADPEVPKYYYECQFKFPSELADEAHNRIKYAMRHAHKRAKKIKRMKS